MCFYDGIKKFDNTTTNNPLSCLLRPPSSNNQLWPLRRRIARGRGVVGVATAVALAVAVVVTSGGHGQHEDDGDDDDAMTTL